MSPGQSSVTIDKERRIAAALAVTMRIAGAKFGNSRYSYWHFDANAGCVWNEEVGVPGSPLVFWHNARKMLNGMRPVPFFCDHNENSMAELQTRLAGNDDSARQSIIIHGDNEEGLEVFAETIRHHENPQHAMGTVIVDQNGYWYRDKNGVGAPVNAVTKFAREFPKIDIVLNLNAGWYGRFKSSFPGLTPSGDVLDGLGKRHWLGSMTGGQSRFLLAVGRNLPTGDLKSLGMHDRNSPLGRSTIARESGERTPEPSLPELPGLFGAPRVQSGSRNCNVAQQLALRDVRSACNGSASFQRIQAMGNVRRSIEPSPDMPCLPL